MDQMVVLEGMEVQDMVVQDLSTTYVLTVVQVVVVVVVVKVGEVQEVLVVLVVRFIW